MTRITVRSAPGRAVAGLLGLWDPSDTPDAEYRRGAYSTAELGQLSPRYGSLFYGELATPGSSWQPAVISPGKSQYRLSMRSNSSLSSATISEQK